MFARNDMNSDTLTAKPDAKDRALTKADVAEFFQVKQRTIDAWMAAKRIPYWKIGKLVRFDLEQVKNRLNGK
jgi:excisionase family DNA binding protein